jgi:hypothetical protein
MRIGQHIPSGEANGDDHVDGDGMVMIKCSGLEKKKNKMSSRQVEFHRAILFWWSRHLMGVIIFRIDSRTIKRGETRIEIRLSKCH